MLEIAGAQASLRILAAGESDIGRRDHNEDVVLVRPDLDLYLVADGAGGENAGNVASSLAVSSVALHFENTRADADKGPAFNDFGMSTGARRLSAAIQHGNRDIIDVAKSSNRFRGMGTTIVAASLSRNASLLHLAHVGDSRAYRVRDGHIELLTEDHSLLNDVVALRPELSEEDIAKLPRNVITRALGMAESVRVAVRTLEVQPGDRYLLCTDGLTDVLEDETLRDAVELVAPGKNPDEEVRLLIELAKQSGGEDNVAAVVIACDVPAGSVPIKGTSAHPRPARRPIVPLIRPRPSWIDSSQPEILILGVEEPPPDPAQLHAVKAPSAPPRPPPPRRAP